MIKVFSYKFFLTPFISHLISCAQTKQVVKNTYSFYKQRFPGKLKTDENGKPFPVKPDTTIIVYVESISEHIEWEAAWQNGRSFSILDQKIIPAPFEAGKLYSEDKKITLFTSAGNFLWQLNLYPEPKQQVAPDEKVNKHEILLKGKFKNKSFFQKLVILLNWKVIPSV